MPAEIGKKRSLHASSRPARFAITCWISPPSLSMPTGQTDFAAPPRPASVTQTCCVKAMTASAMHACAKQTLAS